MAKKKKKLIRRVWTKEDLRLMKSMAKNRKGVTKIAKALKRTPGATTVMAAKRGVSLSMRGWCNTHLSAYNRQGFAIERET